MNGPDRRHLITECRHLVACALRLADEAQFDQVGLLLAHALDALNTELDGDD